MNRVASMWLTRRGIDIAGLAFCLAVSLTAYAFVLAPLVERRASAAAHRRQVQEQQDEYAELKVSARDLEGRLLAAQGRLAREKVHLESAGRTNERIAMLAALAGECGIEIDDVRVGATRPSVECTLVPVYIAGRSRYHDLLTLLSELTRTFADTSVAEFELIGNPAGTAQRHQFKLQLLWYTVPERQVSLQ